ncbi:MAG: SurA N-terminal domain-containing protein [Holosporaceae bacterium]|jgi:peptidyl-prolyl cis-trans isomerase D|nr:SurA N-terminal domain-containing protein [Holosporaceae bacterium]
MISILQRVLQKHHKWLFSILLIIVTISFVFTVGSSPGIGRNTREQKKKVFGCDLTSQREIAQWMQEIELSAQLKNIFIGLSQLKEYVFFARLAALKLANELGIPTPKNHHLNKYIEALPDFQDNEKNFDTKKYNDYLEFLDRDPTQKAVFERTVINDLRVDTIQRLLAKQGYSTDSEINLSLQIDETKYSYSIAHFNYDNISEINHFTENDLEQHLNCYRENYKIDEQVVLEYIEFPNDLFENKIPHPTESEIQNFYTKHYLDIPNIRELEKNSEPWKVAVAEAYKTYETKRMALTTADQFVYQLYEKNIARHSSEFSKLLSAQNLSIKELEPITVGQFSNHQQFSAGTLEQVSKMTQGRYYSDPIISKLKNTVCVLLYKETTPATYPPLAAIKEQVKQDYLKHQAEEFLSSKVDAIRLQLSIPNQTTYDQFVMLVKENNGTITDFKAVKINPDDHDPIYEIVRSLPLRQISQVITKKEKEKELLLVTAKEIPSSFDEAKILTQQNKLEELNKSLFRDYISEFILHELDIKDNQNPIAQQIRIVAPLYYMQILKPRSEL